MTSFFVKGNTCSYLLLEAKTWRRVVRALLGKRIDKTSPHSRRRKLKNRNTFANHTKQSKAVSTNREESILVR